MCVSGIIGGISAATGLLGADKAADAQGDAASQQIALQREQYQQQLKLLQPYRKSGRIGNEAYNFEMGLGEAPIIDGVQYGGFTETPGYQFRLNEGLEAVEAGTAQRHGLASGATMKAMNKFGQDYATGEYTNYLNRLAGLSAQGQSASAGSAAASQNFANAGSNALANAGDARASGYIGANNAIQGGLQNGLSVWAYNNARQ
jgi:hypothetical protein